MGSMTAKLLIALAFILVSNTALPQANTNGNFLFKMWLFLEKTNMMYPENRAGI
jgi:hypothetical protein